MTKDIRSNQKAKGDDDGKTPKKLSDKFVWKPEDIQWEDDDTQKAWEQAGKGGNATTDEKKPDTGKDNAKKS